MDNCGALLNLQVPETMRVINPQGVTQCKYTEPTMHTACWDSLLGADGLLYFPLCSELTTSEYAKLARYHWQTNEIEPLFYSKNLIFPGKRTIRDSKVHTAMSQMPDGRLVMVTHTTDKASDHPAWMPLAYYSNPWEGYMGSSLMTYDPKTNRAENWGIPVPRETLYGGIYHAASETYYAIGFTKGHLYGIHLPTRQVTDHGQVTERASYRLAMGCDDKIYFSTRNGWIQRIHPYTGEVEDMHYQLPASENHTTGPRYLSYCVNGPDGKIYFVGMHSKCLSAYDPKSNSFSVVGHYLPCRCYADGTDTSFYVGCMGFDKYQVLYLAVCGFRLDGGEDYRVPTSLIRWDFLHGKQPKYLGVLGSREHVVVTTCTMQMDTERDLLYVVGSNHAMDGPDVICIRLEQYRNVADTLGDVVTDPYVRPNNEAHKSFGEEMRAARQVWAENPFQMTQGKMTCVPLWRYFENLKDSGVIALAWQKDHWEAFCGMDTCSKVSISSEGQVLDIQTTEFPLPKPVAPGAEELEKQMPFYPGRQYKRKITHTCPLSGDRILAATEDGMLAILQGGKTFSLGPAWINGAVMDMTATEDGCRVYGVAGDRDDLGMVFAYDDESGLRWLGSLCTRNGNYSSAQLSAIAVDPSGTTLAIGSRERMGCVYLCSNLVKR